MTDLKPEDRALIERVIGHNPGRTLSLHDVGLIISAARDEGRCAPPPPVTEVAGDVVRLKAALEWFDQNRGLSLEFDWSDADTDGLDWCVYRETGGRNDREWTVIGSGPTPQAAILAAHKPFADRVPSEAEEGR